MNAGAQRMLGALLTGALIATGAIAQTFTPSIAPIPDIIIGDLTPINSATPGDVATQGAPNAIEVVNDIFEFVDALNLFELVGDVPNTPSVSGFTSDEGMVYTFMATMAPGAPSSTNPDRISINGVRIGPSPVLVDLSISASAELDFKDESFSVDSDADTITVMHPSFAYPFVNSAYDSHSADGPVVAALIDANVITLTVQNQQANTASADFMVWTVDQGPDSISGGYVGPGPFPYDLSGWSYIAAVTAAGGFGPTFTGDSSVTGTFEADAASDGSGNDLRIDVGDTTGDSFVYFVSPVGEIPYDDGGTYRITWTVAESNPSAASTTFRLRYHYGATGILGSGIQQVSPVVAVPASAGTTYEYVVDFLDAAGENADLSELILYFDSVDLIAGVGGSTTALANVELHLLNRASLIAAGVAEGHVTDAWNTSVTGETGVYNTTDSPGVIIDRSNSDFATITSPGPTGNTLTPNQYGFSPNTLAFNGVGIYPFAPSASDRALFRAEFDLDFSGATDANPISQTSLTMAFFRDYGEGLIGQTLSNETNINIVNPLTSTLNSTLSASSYAVYLAVPEGHSLDPADTIGSLIGANVRQIDSNGDGGVLTVNSISIRSYPESVLP